jgi:hypothetical protein
MAVQQLTVAGATRHVKFAGPLKEQIQMTHFSDYEAVLAVIEHGIDVARRNPKDNEPVASDDYIAWCVLQELRRAGWAVTRKPS